MTNSVSCRPHDVNARHLSGVVTRLPLVVVIVLLSGYWIFSARGDLALVSIVVLGSLAVAPSLNPLLYWPVGLMAVVTVGYGGYVALWLSNGDSVDPQFSQVLFGVLTFLFGVVAAMRGARLPMSLRCGWSPLVVSALSSAVPVAIVVMATTRRESAPLDMLSGYMSGGDHGLHNEIIHNMLWWSSRPGLESPISVYSYPRGLHFLVANVISLTSDGNTSGTLTHEYLAGAWFEFVQLAAYIQLATVTYVHWTSRGHLVRAFFLPPIFLGFAAVPYFVPHLLWSGFMTSTGMAWGLLVPIALSIGLRENDDSCDHMTLMAWAWVSLLIFSWIVYQPYVIPVAVVGPLWIFLRSDWSKGVRGLCRLIGSLRSHPVTTVITMSVLASFLPYFVLGRESPGISSLFLDGATRTASLTTVILWTVVALGLIEDSANSRREVRRIVFASVVGFTIAMTAIVFFLGDDGIVAMPYYVQKMYWIVWYISVPLTLGTLMSWAIDRELFGSGFQRVGRLTATWLALIFVPLVQGRTPNAATTHFSVDWFARGVFAVSPSDSEINGAFSMRDKLGSHMANLALRSASRSVLEPNVAISGNPYLACVELAKQGVARVYTTPNGRAELVESGCDPLISYVEDGVSVPSPTLKFFGVRSGVTETFSDKSLGFRLLLRGFRPPEKWGVWAGGYRSALGFQYEENLIDPMLELVVRSWPADEMLRTVRIGVNGTEDISRTLSLSGKTTIMVPLPDGAVGTPMELTLSCDRTSEEILEDDPADGPSPCVGLESMSLVARSG